jgi:Cft2 family RNA processing exonuclease
MVVGSAITMLAKSEIAKEATQMFKDGINGLFEDYERDLQKNKQTVKDIKEGRQ